MASTGREYGVLSVSAPTYAEQLKIACNTVVHRLWSFPGNPLTVTARWHLESHRGVGCMVRVDLVPSRRS